MRFAFFVSLVVASLLPVALAAAQPMESSPSAAPGDDMSVSADDLAPAYSSSIRSTDGAIALVGLVTIIPPIAECDSIYTESCEAAGMAAVSTAAAFAIIPPIVHASKGHPGRAMVSFALRAGLPLGLGLAASDNRAGAVLFGTVTALAADWLLVSRVGLGQAPDHDAPTPAPRRSYSLSTLQSDAASAGLLLTAYGLEHRCDRETAALFDPDQLDSPLGESCGKARFARALTNSSFTLMAGIRHWAEGYRERGILSIAMRAVLPRLGRAVMEDQYGELLGVGIAVAVDHVVLARRPQRRGKASMVVPTMAPAPGGGVLGLGGTF